MYFPGYKGGEVHAARGIIHKWAIVEQSTCQPARLINFWKFAFESHQRRHRCCVSMRAWEKLGNLCGVSVAYIYTRIYDGT